MAFIIRQGKAADNRNLESFKNLSKEVFAQCSTSFFAQIFHHLHTYRVLEVAREREVPFQATRLETKEEAQNAPTPVTTYALFYNGEYLTNEQMNDKRFIKLLDGMEK